MGIANRRQRLFTEEEYLSLEDEALEKSEFFQGKIYAMAGGSSNHSLISGNTVTALNIVLRNRPCIVYNSDFRVRVSQANLDTYPDVSIACANPLIFNFKNTQTLMNPNLILEVLSPSTEKYDRIGKFESYKLIPTLTDYLLVAQDRAKVEHFVRQADKSWSCTVSEGLDAIVKIDTLECELPLSEIYLKIQL